MQLVLSLFPGIGLLDRAFEEEGFCVVRGPDLLWGGDIRNFHPLAGKFDGVIGGPPCQLFSRLRHLNKRAGLKQGNMIPEFERVIVEARPDWFLMENVPEAPEPKVKDYRGNSFLLDNRWLGEDQARRRRFSFGSILLLRGGYDLRKHLSVAALESPRPMKAVLANGGRRSIPVKLGGNGQVKGTKPVRDSLYTIERMLELQGLPAGFLEDAPFTHQGKRKAIGNGVPLPMGRAVARAVKAALEQREHRCV